MTTMAFSEHATKQLKRFHNDTWANSTSQLSACHPTVVEYLERKVHDTLPRCRVDKIQRINCQQMYGMYLLRKEEMMLKNSFNACTVKEVILYHVTTENKGLKSLENGLDWRRTTRSRFGKGVSFSDDADYADFYANHSAGEEKRVIIMCAVLISKISTVKPNTGYNLKISPNNTDTTMSPNCRVYVKYNDYEFYPLYLVYYQKPDRCQSYYFNNGKQIKNRSVEKLTMDHLQEQQRQHQQQKQQLQRLRCYQEQQHEQDEQRQRQDREEQRLRQYREEQRLQRYREEQQLQRYREEQRLQQYREKQRQQFQQKPQRSQNDKNCLIL